MDLRLHGRLPHLILAAAVAGAASSCETLSGTMQGGPELKRQRAALTEARGALGRAMQEGDLERVQTHLGAVGARFNDVEARSSSMNLLDRQHLAIKLATGRRMITEASRWIPVRDVEAVRSEVGRLDGVLAEIDVLLDRAVRTAEASPSRTP